MKRSRKKLKLSGDDRSPSPSPIRDDRNLVIRAKQCREPKVSPTVQKIRKDKYAIVNSPSTGKKFTLLGNSTATTLSDNSRCSSLNDLNVSNLMRLDESLDPSKFNQYLRTPPPCSAKTPINSSPSCSMTTLNVQSSHQQSEPNLLRTAEVISGAMIINTDGIMPIYQQTTPSHKSNRLDLHSMLDDSDEEIFDSVKPSGSQIKGEIEMHNSSTPHKRRIVSHTITNESVHIRNIDKDNEINRYEEEIVQIEQSVDKDRNSGNNSDPIVNKSDENAKETDNHLEENSAEEVSHNSEVNQSITSKRKKPTALQTETIDKNDDNTTNSDTDSDSWSISGGSSTFDELFDTSSESSSTETNIESNNNEDSIRNRNETSEDAEWNDIMDFNTGFIPYSRKSEPNIPADTTTPLEFYQQFVGDDIIMKMVSETNKYAEEFLRTKELKRKSRFRKWEPTTLMEMKVFMGILMVMGVTKIPIINGYWSRKKCYRNEYIASLMSRDHFLMLLKFWHFSEEITGQSDDKLHKIRNVLDMLQKRFSEMLKPGKFLVIDETMIPWRGRLKFRQYIKNKSHRYGIKLYKLCTPEGYTYSILTYTGKDDTKNTGAGHGHDVVMELTKNLLDEGRILIADNFYTSVKLGEDLLKRKTSLCGTLRTNRKLLPGRFMKKKLKKGEIAGKMNKKGVKVIRWADKRVVTMLTTCKEHKATLKDTGKKCRKTNESVMKLAAVMMYNDNKKGVDFSDQMTAYYSTLKKGLKWYRKLMMCLLFGTCLINAWLLHSLVKENEEKMSLLNFLESVIQDITGASLTDPGAALAKEKRRIHTMIKKNKFHRCTKCYSDLRETLTPAEAGKKCKKVRTFCVECDKAMCLDCYNNVHSV